MEIHAHREPPFNHPTAKIKHLLTAASRSGLLRLAFKALPILALTLLSLLGLHSTPSSVYNMHVTMSHPLAPWQSYSLPLSSPLTPNKHLPLLGDFLKDFQGFGLIFCLVSSFALLLFSGSVVSDSWPPPGLQHARLPLSFTIFQSLH